MKKYAFPAAVSGSGSTLEVWHMRRHGMKFIYMFGRHMHCKQKGRSRFHLFIAMLLIAPGGLILICGCASQPSNPLQAPERFAEIYAKVLLANEVETAWGPPQTNDARTRSARADSVLRALKVDRQQFEAAVKYFGEHPERWQKVFARVVEILEAHMKSDSVAGFGGEKRGE